MSAIRRAIAAVVVAASLAACAGIPVDGPVHAGDTGVATPGPVLPILQGPQSLDDAGSIMQGFLTASAGGAVSGFDIAREFLTARAALDWEPLQKVTIFDSRAATLYIDASGLVTYSLPVAATVDESGVMTETAPEVRQDIVFTITQDEAGEYRISSLEDGIIVSEASFVRFFKPVSLQFASTDIAVVVPDLRWFANNEQLATAAARELIEGPSAFLTDAVVTGFPATSSLAVDAVVVEDGLAQVSLAAGSAGTPEERALAAEQMEETLRQLPNVLEVETTVGGVPLTAAETDQLFAAPIPEQAAGVVAGQRLGTWDSTQTRVTPDSAGAVPADARDLALAYDLRSAAFATTDGIVVTDAPLAAALFVDYDDSMVVPEGELESTLVIAGTGLVGPSFDRFGGLWTTPASSDGEVWALPPRGTQGDAVTLTAPWLVGRTVDALAVSRDGARIAILSRVGQQPVLEVAAVVRDASGAPLSLGEPLVLAPSLRPSIEIAWSDPVNLVALGEAAGDITEATVGGRTGDISALTGATGFSVRFGDFTIVAVTEAGGLHVRTGNSWASQVPGVTDVAYAG